MPKSKTINYQDVYADAYGALWDFDSIIMQGLYHGWSNRTFRGKGMYKGSQATYGFNGKAIDSGRHMGTWDYSSPDSFSGYRKHKQLDVSKHTRNNDNEYTPNLSYQY